MNLDLAIIVGTVPTLYGEVESSHFSDDTSFKWLDQCSARILSYTNKCFSVYAKSDIIHIKFYQRDDNRGTVYCGKQHYNHSPVDQNQVPQQNSLQYAIYGEPQGNNIFAKGFNEILMDLVKIMLFMEPRAHDVYSQSGLHDQFAAQPDYPQWSCT